MIKQILKESFTGIVISYVITILEFLSFSLMPYVLGLAIDDLLAGNLRMFLLYAFVLLFGMVIGTFRRMLDTRIFGRIYTSKAKFVIDSLKASSLDSKRIIGRYGLVGLYSDFFEFTLPNLIGVLIGVGTSVLMIWLIEPTMLLIVPPAFAVSVYANWKFSSNMQRLEYEMQHTREEINHSLVEGEDCDSLLCQQYTVMVRKSDIDSVSWCTTDFINLTVELACLYLITSSGLSLGEITSVLMYVGRMFDKAHAVQYLFHSLRLLQMTDDLLGDGSNQRVQDRLDA